MARKKLLSKGPSLGAILVSLGYCTWPQIEFALNKQTNGHSSVPLGAILSEFHIVTDEQLEHALTKQRVLQGHENPDRMKRFGTDQRNDSLRNMVDKFREVAKVSMLLAEKVKG